MINDFVMINYIKYDNMTDTSILPLPKIIDVKHSNKFIILEWIDNYNRQIVKNFLSLLNNFKEIIININTELYLTDLENSYKSERNIYEQFTKDIKRMKFFINNHPTIDIINIRTYLESEYNYDITKKILMISTQAVMGIPYQIIQKSLDKYNNLLLVELPDDENHDKNLYIYVNINNKNDKNNINFTIYKSLRIIQMDKHGNYFTKYIIKICIILDLNKENVVCQIISNKIRN